MPTKMGMRVLEVNDRYEEESRFPGRPLPSPAVS